MNRMSNSSSIPWLDRTALRLDRQAPYLRIFFSTVFVRDQDRSLQFYCDVLGFTLVADNRFDGGGRWVAVAPPDGSGLLALVTPAPDSAEYSLIGRGKQTVFITEDVQAVYETWHGRGVSFQHPPQTPIWGGMFTTFEDNDGNSFSLVAFDKVSRQIEAQRQSLAERLESDRRAAQDLKIATQVQARLFPQTQPKLRTLDYAGLCLQARQVGGDYFDFLDLGQDRVALVMGDVSGKGIAAALMMAGLQASLRSQCAIAVDQPLRLLQSVNRLFFENSTDSAFATLFFAEYDDRSGRIRFANCGHLAALLHRADGTLEWLDSTCTVLGIFDDWGGSMAETWLRPGDTLVMYTDGVTEACNEAGELFGTDRLAQIVRRHPNLSSQDLLNTVVHEVRLFCPNPQDDTTLLIAKHLAT